MTELTQEQKQRAVDWLKQRGAPKQCAACGHNNWTLGNHLVMPMTWDRGNINIGGPAYPQIMVICGNCGNTMYFNAVIIGLAQQPPQSGAAPNA